MSVPTHDVSTARLLMLNLIDEHTRECLLICTELLRTLTRVVEALAKVMVQRSGQQHLRSDNVLTRKGKAAEKRIQIRRP